MNAAGFSAQSREASKEVVLKAVGRASELWRYPVKSMLGESCEMLDFNARGVKGDRRFAIRDSKGKFGSGKNTRRFRKIDGLFRFASFYQNSVPHIRLPTGEVLNGSETIVHEVLSQRLGQSVVLEEEAAVSHLDAGPVHIISSASLAWLQAALPLAQVDARRFRPNLVVALPGATPVEQQWIGKRLRIGQEVELAVSGVTERCGMVAFAQEELLEDPKILRYIAQASGVCFGVYAEVVVPGSIWRNDVVALIE